MSHTGPVMLEITERQATVWATPAAGAGQLVLRWLGQAGFLLFYHDLCLLIDPYLSDCLAHKYAGTNFPHTRMMPAPLMVEQLDHVDAVLCTHRHSDHMDPETLPLLARRFPACRFVLPRAERETALSLGLPAERLLLLNDGEQAALDKGGQIRLEALASAHETLRVNEAGEHHYLGYLIHLGEALTLYHPGDCVPYEGLETRLAGRNIDLMLLPVNGRRPQLSARGILGNFCLEEAITLWQKTGASFMLAHHFGLFDFNTVDPRRLQERIEAESLAKNVIIPEIGRSYILKTQGVTANDLRGQSMGEKEPR